jgi:hypothetical protein
MILCAMAETAERCQRATSKVSPIILPARDGGNKSSSRSKGRNVVKKTRRTEKTVEIHEFYAIRTASGSLPALCADCSTGDAIMVAPEQAAVFSHLPTRMIYRWVESGAIHYREAPDGSLIVCVRSLAAAGNQVIEAKDDNTKKEEREK